MALTKVIGDGTGTIDNLTVADAGTIGSASKTNAITIASSGLVQLTSTGIGTGSQVFQVIDDGATLFQIRSEDGNVSFPQSGAGIYLGVTSGTAANLLSDFERGTFTPAYSATGATFSNYSAQEGKYTKIGNRVCFTIYLQLDGSNTFSGNNLSITGLPFAPSHSMYYKVLGRYLNFDSGSAYYDACILTSASSTTVTVRQLGDNVAGTALTANALSNVSGQVWVTGTYATDS